MPKTLLAVDDSATMRKVLEITFSGEDYRVVTADSASAAIAKLSEEPRVVVIDTMLGNDDGYALSKEIRKRDGSATIVLLSSRHNPYDAAKGKDSGADDFMDKPFDTQQMVDKVRKILQARESGAVPAAPQAGATVVGVAPAKPAAAAPAPVPAPAASPAPTAAAAAAAKPAAARAHTLMFGGNEPAAKPAAPAPAPAPAPAAAKPAPAPAPAPVAAKPVPAAAASPQPPKVAPAPTPAAAPAAPPAAAAASAGVAGKVNGQMAAKLGDLGLTPQQVEGVLALSREVVERVVWEVVPDLAETLIKEEIARLMKP